ncbi:transaldolase [Candidatus Kaiserbacteria bacterium]|nr:transaldolase [Candidatus Kaiserbacteria bacterium]
MNTAKPLTELRVKIFADGSAKDEMLALSKVPYIKGFTTNPTLMHKAGVKDYAAFAKEIIAAIPDKPISFEVFSDDFMEMEREARIIGAWGKNVYVKIPIMNTRGQSSAPLVKKLSDGGFKLNVTMILTPAQVRVATEALNAGVSSIISVFAGRAADVGVDPMPIMRESKKMMSAKPSIELLWASTRELYNIYEAEEVGAEIITVPPSILKKIAGIGKGLDAVTLEGVQTFYDDGRTAGYKI